MPSAFSHEILNANPYAYLDDAPLEERRARAVEMRRVLPEAVLSEIGRLDPAAIAEVRADAWPDVRDADELHDALLTLVALPVRAGQSDNEAVPACSPAKSARSVLAWQRILRNARRAAARRPRHVGDRKLTGCRAERAKLFAQIFPARAVSSSNCREVGEAAASREDAVFAMVTGWMAHSGPVDRARELAALLGTHAG